MTPVEEFIKRLMVLGEYCYPERAEDAVSQVFGCMKAVLASSDVDRIYALLPAYMKELWQKASVIDTLELKGEDCVGLLQRAGNFPYRAAAERTFKAVFAAMKERIDCETEKRLRGLIPIPLRRLYDDAGSCVVDGSAEEFL